MHALKIRCNLNCNVRSTFKLLLHILFCQTLHCTNCICASCVAKLVFFFTAHITLSKKQ